MKKIAFLKILFIVILSSVFLRFHAQESGVSWDYSIKPGSKEWNERDNRQNFMEGLRIMNIPKDTLKLLNTEHLVKVCVNYPFWGLVFTRNSLQEGYEFIRNNFNGFRELENRSEAAQYLYQEYIKMNPSNFKPVSTLAQKGEYMAQFTFIELLLAQHAIINNTDEELKRKIVEESLIKFQEKLKIRSYGIEGLVTTAYVMARYSNSLNYSRNLFNEIPGNKSFLNNCIEIDLKSLKGIAGKTEYFMLNR